ncbi:TPA: NAD(+) kinase [Candidatus Poribacteria bacterium]|nr:NAD(+) kinase [Candidatus Poribacteria bacterium]
MNTIGIIANLTKDGATKVVAEVSNWLNDKGITTLITKDCSANIDSDQCLIMESKEIVQKADALIVFGGDGTILSVSHIPGVTRLPILPINMGGLGFLTEVGLDELYTTLEKVLDGNYQLDERMMLRAKIINPNTNEAEIERTALNDAVINKGAFSRMIWLETYIDQEYVSTVNGDGIIISTPSGCTAYSLSAGGPIVCPNLNVFIITYICPHTLSFRPQIVPAESKISVIVKSLHSNILLAIDGQEGFDLEPNSIIQIDKAPETIKLIRSEKRSYYEILRTKLKWGESMKSF